MHTIFPRHLWNIPATGIKRDGNCTCKNLCIVRETKTESITRMVKLIDTIHDVAGLLQRPLETRSHPGFQGWLERMQKTAAQFEFELRTELVRIGAEISSSRHQTGRSLKSGLDTASESYQQALSCNVTAHTRAMLVRQSAVIQKAVEEFRELERAA